MIKANELRIGNYYKHPTSINDFDVMEDIDFISVMVNQFKPIPLTEEWLLRLGFTRHHEDYGNDIVMLKSCVHQPREGMTYKIYPDELGSAEMPKNAKRIKYVHQLQNLYFALTGEELTLKDEVL